MKLALDVWYEAWGRTADQDAAGASEWKAVAAPEAGVCEGAGGDRGGHRLGETVGDSGPAPCAGL